MKISKFQELMKNLYFHQDTRRGIKSTFIWLVEEIGELATLLNKKVYESDKIGEELADIVAWTCSLANLLNINLETALYEKYPNKCRKCGFNPCRCNK